jgi:hypothetical protein
LTSHPNMSLFSQLNLAPTVSIFDVSIPNNPTPTLPFLWNNFTRAWLNFAIKRKKPLNGFTYRKMFPSNYSELHFSSPAGRKKRRRRSRRRRSRLGDKFNLAASLASFFFWWWPMSCEAIIYANGLETRINLAQNERRASWEMIFCAQRRFCAHRGGPESRERG